MDRPGRHGDCGNVKMVRSGGQRLVMLTLGGDVWSQVGLEVGGEAGVRAPMRRNCLELFPGAYRYGVSASF